MAPGSVQVVDDGDAGFSTVGSWSNAAPGNGYQGDLMFDETGTGTETARWTFSVDPGTSWKVATTWKNSSNRATDAPFTIYDGATAIKTIDINQELAPNDFSYNGANWEWLSSAAYHVSSGTLTVELTDDANEYVIADGVYLQQVPTRSIISGGNAFQNLSFVTGDFVTGDQLQAGGNLTFSGGSLTLSDVLDIDGDLTLGAGTMLDVSASNHAVSVGGAGRTTAARSELRPGP